MTCKNHAHDFIQANMPGRAVCAACGFETSWDMARPVTPTPDDILAELERKEETAKGLRKKLHTSLRIQDFFPGAFKHGSCKVGAYGNIRHAPRRAKLTITTGDGTKHEFPLLETPYSIWPATVQEEWKTIPRHLRPAIKD